MANFSGLIVQRRWAAAVVCAAGVLALLSIYGAVRVEHDDDLLAFLPQDNPDVSTFYEINKQFGGLDVALVGVETQDVLAPAFLTRLRAATKALNEEPSIQFALSLANVDDFRASTEGGIVTDLLISRVPKDAAAQAALKKKVMSKDLVVGQLISKNGKAVLIYCFANYGSDPRAFADSVRQIVQRSFEQDRIYWGGAPFISSYIYTATQEDLRKLTPWAVAVIVLLIFLSFRDLFGATLALVSTGMGIVMSMGLMGLLGVRYNIVLSSMPVILFSVGSAYGIHVLARYYQLFEVSRTKQEALERTLRDVGPTVWAAGLTTVLGLLSFLAMDIKPMRTFGIFTALGIFITLVLSLTFVPAVISLLNVKPKRVDSGRFFSGALLPIVTQAQGRRKAVGAALLLLAGVGGFFALQVDTRMDQTAFFAKGSAPDEADRFLLRHFGGSQFVQIHLTGDFSDPHVLRELQRISDALEEIELISSVQHISMVIAQINEAMESERRVPDSAAKVKLLYRFLEGRKAVEQLVNPDKTQAVLHAKIRSSDVSQVQGVLRAVEKLAREDVITKYRIAKAEGQDAPRVRARQQQLVLGRIRSLARLHGAPKPDMHALKQLLERPAPTAQPARVQAALARFLSSSESLVELSSAQAQAAARAVAGLGPGPSEEALEGALKAALTDLSDPEALEDVMMSLETPLVEIWRRQRAQLLAGQITASMGQQANEPLMRAIAMVLPTLEANTAMLPSSNGEGALLAKVNGLPVLHRGLSISATRNQLLSLALALSLVVVLLSIFFRSVTRGLIATSPTALTLLVIYGGMGALGVHLDIGTSMLASIIIGAGVDYAVHLVDAWRGEDAATTAVRKTGPAIWTNALMVAAGFFLLTMGEARTLQNVGGLTAAAMITAALTTFLCIPVLEKKAVFRPSGEDPATVPKDSLLEG